MSKETNLLAAHDKAVVAKLLARETFKLLMDSRRLMNDESPLDRPTAVLFMAEFLVLILKDVFTDKPLDFEEGDHANHISKGYNLVKQDLEGKIGFVFSVVVKKFTGKDLPYTCEIRPTQAPKPGWEN
jgi:hypothetical protein